MMLTCATCGRPQPLSDEDVAAFHPRFFCLTCGAKIAFEVPEPKLAELRRSNDRSRMLAAGDVKAVPAAGARKVVKRDGAEAGGGG